MIKLKNLDEIDFPLITSYGTKEGQVKYVKDIIKQELQKHISESQAHLVLSKEGMTCPIFDRKDICTNCHIAHWLEQFVGADEDESIRKN